MASVRDRLARIVGLGTVVAAAGVAAAGCWGESGRIDAYTCEDPCGNGQPGTSCDDPCGDCVGQCIPIAPLHFDGPMIVYIGRELDAPECPAQAPVQAYQGYADMLDTSFQCAPCECAQPACVLPDGVTASNQVCPGDGPGATQIPLDAPATWSGQCVSPGIVTANNLDSVTIAPVSLRPCAPVPPEVAPSWQLDPIWKTFARACKGQVENGRCADPGLVCVPTAEPPPPGFRQCIAAPLGTDPICPETYKTKYTFYERANDTRGCTECSCQEETAGSGCTAWISLYQDSGCATPLLSTMIGDTEDCHDVGAPGAQLGGMEGSWLMNDPGTCTASGGVAFGEVVEEAPSVFCCQDPP